MIHRENSGLTPPRVVPVAHSPPSDRRTAGLRDQPLWWDIDLGVIASGSNKLGEHYTTT